MITKQVIGTMATVLLGASLFISCNGVSDVQENVATNADEVALVEDSVVAEEINSQPAENTTVSEAEEMFVVAEQAPEFPGGEEARLKFIETNIVYPEQARKEKISGTVYTEFVVGKDGKISDVKVYKGIGGGCDEEALRIVNMFPNWKPGKQKGKEVMVRFRMPIKFTLNV